MNPIQGQSTFHLQLPLTQQLQHLNAPSEGQPQSFLGLIASGVDSVNHSQHDAQSQVHEMLTGGDVSQVEVLTAVQKADMAFRLLVQVRNKLMAAYEEINAIRI